MDIIWWILLGIGIAIVLHFILVFVAILVKTMKNFKGQHHCNDCKQSFLIDVEKQYRFCPYCGKLLTYHFEDERFKQEKEIDKDMSKLNEIITEENVK